MFIFLKYFKQKNNVFLKKTIFFKKNNFFIRNMLFFKKFEYIFPNKNLKNILGLLSNLLSVGVNFLLLDDNYNYNYLPINNLFKCKKKFYKTVKYYNIKILFFLGLRPRIVKSFFDLNLLNINVNIKNNGDIMCYSPKLKNLKIFHYILYVFILNIYVKK